MWRARGRGVQQRSVSSVALVQSAQSKTCQPCSSTATTNNSDQHRYLISCASKCRKLQLLLKQCLREMPGIMISKTRAKASQADRRSKADPHIGVLLALALSTVD